MIMPLTWAGAVRAGEGNRTLMTSLEGWGSTIELRPRTAPARPVWGSGQHVIMGSVLAYRGGRGDRMGLRARGSGWTGRLRSA